MTDTAPAPINWGDEIEPDSVWDFEHLGYSPVKDFASVGLIILSRDGSRRIVRAVSAGVINPLIIPNRNYDPPRVGDSFQSWTGIKLYAEWVKDDPGQTVLMLQPPRGEGSFHYGQMPGMFMPNGTIAGQTRPVPDAVNPIPRANTVRDTLATIAAGWDVTWHSRYVFSDHLRQQVTSRIVDGLLADIERDLQTLLAKVSPTRAYWEAKLLLIDAKLVAVCGLCTGDPYVWARVLARNLDLTAFRVRLDQGEIPAVNLATKPWQPALTVAAATFPPNTDVNAKKELAARWHDTNRAVVEDHLLAWFDEVLNNPEPTYESADDHFHGR